ncbi:MAG: hypothetical protein HON35_02265 [Actinobacteria bacterium]|nr:hypothetical protein [Actinomycetota bacterium]
MNEKALLELWNQKRSQIITAQMAPTLVLISILVVSVLDYFAVASDSAKILAIGVAAATGILAVISQYAAIREAKALIADINKIDEPSALAKKIGESDAFLALTAIAIVALSLAIFALVIWTVLA